MKIAILGNGVSRKLYNEEENYDKVLGCNLPPKGIHLDYVCCVDAKAVGLAYRTNAPHYNRLRDEDFKLVLGSRARHGLTKSKAVPGGTENLKEYLKRKGYIYKIIELLQDAREIGQRYFSAGHLAFAFACEEWPDSDIHLYGFDSLFTGHQGSHSQYLRNPETDEPVERYRKKHTNKTPHATVGSWYWIWERLINSDRNTAKSINIHTYQDDPPLLESLDKLMNVIRHEEKKVEECNQD